ncbi:hypothetical protein QF038_002257 [Pseudarthrobacter sp. W1I19]|nr:hypothetical protein [Pseudarthrobacter sp. W1I19]
MVNQYLRNAKLGLKRSTAAEHALGDLLDAAHAIDLGQDAAPCILIHNGAGLLMVEVQAVADDGLIVVGAAGFLRPVKQAVNEFVIACRQLQYGIELLAAFGEDLVQVVRLRDVRG